MNASLCDVDVRRVGRKRGRAGRAVALLVAGALGVSPGVAVGPGRPGGQGGSREAALAIRWIRHQQVRRTGLFISYDMPGETTAWTYDQALAIKALLATGSEEDVAAAARCAAGMLVRRDPEQKVWADGYNALTAVTHARVRQSTDTRSRWVWRLEGGVSARALAVGPNAWMGLALLDLAAYGRRHPRSSAARLCPPQRCLQAAEGVAGFILRFQMTPGQALPDGRMPALARTDGAIVGGLDEHRKVFPWVSTEHNVDSIAFLSALAGAGGEDRYLQASLRAARWLDREMWEPSHGSYWPGYSDPLAGRPSDYNERLDPQTWSVLALAAAGRAHPKESAFTARNGLAWIAPRVHSIDRPGGRCKGFAKTTFVTKDSASVWSEGTAGYVLAGRRIQAKDPALRDMEAGLRLLQQPDGGVLYSAGADDKLRGVAAMCRPGDIAVCHFEAHPSALFGNVGVYGRCEPDWDAILALPKDGPVPAYSWYYHSPVPGFSEANLHSGSQSFRLVNGGRLCLAKKERDGTPVLWSSLGMNLGPPVNADGSPSEDPNVVRPLDVSRCQALVFWGRTDAAKGARIAVGFRDAFSGSPMPQVTVPALRVSPPGLGLLTGEWTRFGVPLRPLAGRVNLRALVHVNLAFGDNPEGTVIHVDDVAFVRSLSRPAPGTGAIPCVYPLNWPFGSIAGSAWLVFVLRDLNPFEPVSGAPAAP